METYLFVDTETTGFPKSGPLIQEGQARVCQLALILTDANGGIITKFCSLIKPDGWKISEGAQKVHGITDEQCEKYGIGFISAIGLFHYLANMATTIVAHNNKFDSKMLGIETAYAGSAFEWVERKWHCTMETNTHITGGKFPKLHEAYTHYTGKQIESAHDALADAEACLAIFFAGREKEKLNYTAGQAFSASRC